MNYVEKLKLVPLVSVVSFLLLTISAGYAASDPLPQVLGYVDGTPYQINIWDRYQGNHRVLVKADSAKDAVAVDIKWRRRDPQVKRWNVTVLDPQGKEVKDRTLFNVTQDSCSLVFSSATGPGTYEVYYLKPEVGANSVEDTKPMLKMGVKALWRFPTFIYQSYTETASKDWLAHVRKNGQMNPSLPKANVIAFEALLWMGAMKEFDSFNSFYPMELVVTSSEKERLLSNSNPAFALFPELREYPIRMFNEIPYRWTTKEYNRASIKDTAKQNEYLVFQVGVYAKTQLDDVKIRFSDLASKNASIKSDRLTSFNHGGNDWEGNPFTTKVSVEKDAIQPIWIGLDIPRQTPAGIYTGQVEITAAGKSSIVPVEIQIGKDVLEDRGDSDIFNLSRLRWLNSTIGINDEVLAPYIPIVQSDNNTLKILGRQVQLGANGLPAQVKSFIDMDKTTKEGRALFAKAPTFDVLLGAKKLAFSYGPIRYTKQSNNEVKFETKGVCSEAELTVQGTLESDGYMRYAVTLQARKALNNPDIRIEIPMHTDVARYKSGALGMGYIDRPTPNFNTPGMMQQAAWIGDYNAGIMLWLKNKEEEWNGDNSTKKTLPILENWVADKNMPLFLERSKQDATFGASTAAGTLKKGEEKRFDFALLLTPFRPISSYRWSKRTYHPPYSKMPEEKYEEGANYVNLHHATKLNPYINFPFLGDDKLKPYADKLHKRGQKLKLYYTCRELSVNLPELWMLRSLKDEVFIVDRGFLPLSKKPWSEQESHFIRAGSPWVGEHLVDGYRSRWQSIVKRDDHEHVDQLWHERDCSIATQGLSRWHNYYLEGVKWLASKQSVELDGLYLDGIGYDRGIMKRLRKAVNDPEFKLDYHGATYRAWLSHAPYLDNIWFGESANYTKGADYWLTEVSGICWGTAGEILKGAKKPDIANHFKGMVFGITRRMGWNSTHISNYLWEFWEDFGIAEAQQYGFWLDYSPVSTDHEEVKVGVYVRQGKTFLSVANFTGDKVDFNLKIDWKGLGLNPSQVNSFLPAIKEHQAYADIDLSKPLTLSGNDGMFICIGKEKDFSKKYSSKKK